MWPIWAMNFVKSDSNSMVLGVNMSYCFLFRFMDTVWNCLARISMPSIFDFPRGSNILNSVIICVIYNKECLVTLRDLVIRVGFKFKKWAWTAPFQAACRSPQTCQKSDSLKHQRASFQDFPYFFSLLSGSMTDTPEIGGCSPAKNRRCINKVACWF